MDVGEIIHTQRAFGSGPHEGGGRREGGAVWESETAQYNMINIIEVMQMVRRMGALWRETILNGYFCSNYALICVDGRCGVDVFSRLSAKSDW